MSEKRKKSLMVAVGCLYFVFCVFVFANYSQSKLMNVEVVNIHDGDTVTLKFENGFEFSGRLADVDAPEIGQSKATESRDYLESLLHIEGLRMWTESRDYYGRPLVHLVGENYLDINLSLVRGGYAWLNSVGRSRRASFKTAIADAKREQLGIWGEEKPCEPKKFRKFKCPSQQ